MKSAEMRRKQTIQSIVKGSAWMLTLFIIMNWIPAAGFSYSEMPALQPSIDISAKQARMLEDTYGIQIMSLRLTSAGYMLDFRYRILDQEKAKYLMNKELKPYILDSKTGRKLFVPNHPKIGSMRAVSAEPKSGRSYYILFSNTEGILKSGRKVSIVIGDLTIKGLKIQ